MKTSNCWVFTLLTDQVQKRLKSWILELNFVSDLAQVDEAKYTASYNIFSSK